MVIVCLSKPALLVFFLSGGILVARGQQIPHPSNTSPHSDTLAPVTITPGYPPMRIKGDTIEYNTAGVKMKVNATVEELLKRLPGLEIDAQGGITFNGQRIQKLLVDGEDIFGSDPRLITRNLNADMIAKIQVLDKKSARAEFTGVDDGERIKTLNLTLKDDRKRGSFGNLQAGADASGYYNDNALLGAFRDKRQLAAIAKSANNGETIFNGAVGDLGSGISLSGGVSDPLGASAGAGIPRVMGAALHYSNDWNNGQEHAIGNFQASQLYTRPVSSSLTEQILPDSVYQQNQQSSSTNSLYQQSMAVAWFLAPDTLSALHLYFSGMDGKGHNQYSSSGDGLFNDTLVNSSLKQTRSDVDSRISQGAVMWRRAGRKKKDRVFSLLGSLAKQDNTAGGYLYSLNSFFRPDGSLSSADTTDQRKQYNTHNLSADARLNYTEPLWFKTQLAIGYGLSFNRNQSLQNTYNKGDGKYDLPVDSLSSQYQSNLVTQKIRVNLQSAGKALHYVVGGEFIQNSYLQRDLVAGARQRYRYFYFTPTAFARYNLSNTRSVYGYYTASVQLPTISQLQPVQNNNDPLHILTGNPGLQPSSTHVLQVNYQSLGATPLQAGFYGSFTTNSITTKTYTDSLGRQVSGWVNTSGAENAGLNFSVGRKVRALDLRVNTSLTYHNAVNFVDLLLSRNNTYTGNLGFSMALNDPDKYHFGVHSNLGYSYLSSSINTAAPTRYWSQNYSGDLGVFPFPGLELNTSGNYSWRQKTAYFDKNNAVFLWNAFVGKNFLRNRLVVKWQIDNILGQNTGIGRTITANQISENYSNIIGRYWMLSAAFHFVRVGKNRSLPD
ncbi:MAG: TonB-dependent receptor [Puia sp.]|nr:TonB-dependent receptor [Puia sp.]